MRCAALGVGKGDRVVIYMPMVPEAVVAMLACARIGAVHSVVFGGFAPAELAARIDDARPKVVVSASCGIEPTRVVEYKPMLDAALERASHQPEHCVVLQREQAVAAMGERDVDWDDVDAARDATTGAGCVAVAATDPLYILYTSGTTGQAEGHRARQRRPRGRAALVDGATSTTSHAGRGVVDRLRRRLGRRPLLHRLRAAADRRARPCSTRASRWARRTPARSGGWSREHGVSRAVHRADRDPGDQEGGPATARCWPGTTSPRCGRCSSPASGSTPTPTTGPPSGSGVPVVDHWWQTETGWPIAANLRGPRADADQARLADRAGARATTCRCSTSAASGSAAGVEGAICLRLPLPPGTLPTLWGDDERYVASYLSAFEGYYLTGDGGYVDEDGYLFVMGRTDDVINVAGHRLSTGSMEAVLAGHPAVAECAVIGVADELKGQVPAGPRRAQGGHRRRAPTEPASLQASWSRGCATRSAPVAALRQVDIVAALPKTRSGKILRKTMREIADGAVPTVPGDDRGRQRAGRPHPGATPLLSPVRDLAVLHAQNRQVPGVRRSEVLLGLGRGRRAGSARSRRTRGWPTISGGASWMTGSPRSSARQYRPASNSALDRKPRSSRSDSSSSNVSLVALSLTSSMP